MPRNETPEWLANTKGRWSELEEDVQIEIKPIKTYYEGKVKIEVYPPAKAY